MKLFGANGVIDTADFELFPEQGTCADIYKKDNIILKCYKGECNYKSKISTKVFQRLKEFDIPHIVKLYDSYYADVSKFSTYFKMDAYTSKYAGERIDSLLKSSREYFLEMVLALEQILPLLTKARIFLNDKNAFNILFSKNNVTILDPDLFSISNFHSSSYIQDYNRDAILEYIIASLLSDARKLKEEEGFLYDICSLRRIDLNSLSTSFASVFTDETPYLSLKKHRGWRLL
ncbi:MAG: hypothetical protein IJ743_02235 [Bacilli bacterium]|nr:hypothetical protein [Bacilli bacterium]